MPSRTAGSGRLWTPATCFPTTSGWRLPEFARSDVREQWGALLRTRLESRLDRARLAQWEVRNLRMAAHIRQAASGFPDGRVLVVVGAGHKAWLDHFLAQLYDVRLVSLSEVVEERPAATAGGDGAGQ